MVQVIDEYLGEVVYTLRIKGKTWRPKVFREAVYTIKVIGVGAESIIEGVKSVPEDDNTVIVVELK